ncbi:MAG: ShlB/FhaC/HecB family hemolysin secretion/activation protein [Chakrabartia sp.]
MYLCNRNTLLAAMVVTQPYFADSANAQTVSAPTRDELQRDQIPTIAPQTKSRLTIDGDIERAPCPLADPRFANVVVNFSTVSFDNLKSVDPASLDGSWREFAGKSLPIATVCEIRDRAATALRRQGYLAAVQVPPQRIEDGGVVHFDVLMAKVIAVQVRGDAGASERKIAGYLEAITNQPAFNAREAERALLLARDVPGYDVRLTLRPAGTVPGEVIGEVTVTHQRFQIDANIQNLGSHDVGRIGGLLRGQINGITGLGDSTNFSIFNTIDTKEQTILQAGHSFLAGKNGLRISGDFTYAWTQPTLVPVSPIKSETLIASLNAAYPFVRRQARNLSGVIGFELINQDVRFGAVALTSDHLRIAYARINFDGIDPRSISSTVGYSTSEPRWRFGGSVEMRQGISVFGASAPCGAGFVNCLAPRTPLSRIEGDPTALVMRASYIAEYRPVPNIAVSLTPRAQYANKPLVSFEEFSVGNYTVGRGYDAGVLLGDSGLGLQAEVRVGSLQPRRPNSIALQPFAYVDGARVWNQDVLTPLYLPGRSRLYSAGGGVRAVWGNHARLDLTLAVPLERAGLQTKRSGTRLLFSLTTQLFPWKR